MNYLSAFTPFFCSLRLALSLAAIFTVFPFLSASVVEVSDSSGLTSALSSAEPGQTILLKDGNYSGGFSVDLDASADEPLLIIAENVKGAVFTDVFSVGGRFITISGLHFTGSPGGELQILSGSSNCRVTRCSWDDSQALQWLTVLGNSHEIDHNLFENKTNNAIHDGGCPLLKVTVSNNPDNVPERHWIHHNHFRDVADGLDSNGFETLQMITSGNPFLPSGSSQSIIEYNIFERCDGESEIISNKSNDNTYRYNVFLSSQGGLVLRHGIRNTVDGNYFKDCSYGVRFQGTDQVIINNYFDNLGYGVRIMKGIMSDVPVREGKSPYKDNFYTPVEDCVIANNTFSSSYSDIEVSAGHSHMADPTNTGVHPVRVTFANNILQDSSGWVFLYRNGFSDPLTTRQWVIEGNIKDATRYIGSEGAELNGVASVENLNGILSERTDGVFEPKLGSLLIDGSVGEYSQVSKDLYGRGRDASPDVGAVEFIDGGAADSFVSSSDVGPLANSAPIAVNDSYSVIEGSMLEMAASGGVLLNDSDPERDSMSAVLQNDAANGSVVLNDNGSFSYVPNPGFSGVDTFTYSAFDLLGSFSSAQVSIDVVSFSGSVKITATGASTLSANAAVLNGMFSGAAADITVVWDVSDHGTVLSDWPHQASLGMLFGGVFKAHVNISEGDTIFYRCYAVNDSGEFWSDLSSFTLPGERYVLIESFDSYAAGSAIGGQGDWGGDSASTTEFSVRADPDNPQNRVLFFDQGVDREVYVNSTALRIPDGGVSTLFYRFRADPVESSSAPLFLRITLSDKSSPTSFGDGETDTSLVPGADGNAAFSAGGAVDLNPSEWYYAWMVVDNANDSFSTYVSDLAGNQLFSSLDNAFRNGSAANDLLSLMFKVNSNGGNGSLGDVWIDDIYVYHGADYSAINPLNSDVDEDGYDDQWEFRYFADLQTVGAVEASDFDADGHSDRFEWRVGTNPRDPASKLELDIEILSDQSAQVAWPSSHERSYVLQYKQHLTDPAWTDLESAFAGDFDVETRRTYQLGENTGFFRVGVVD